MSRISAKLQDTLNYPPRGMDADRSAAYCGLSRTKFLDGVESGDWPQPKDVSGVMRWDRVEIDAAWDAKQQRDRKRSFSGRRVSFDELEETFEDGTREAEIRQ
jgi:predicted DNA-binding transcriptional regulator AlpA